MSARFEIVRTDAHATGQPWHARFVAGNGRIVWVTETYSRRRGAESAIELIVGAPIVTSPFAAHPEISRHGHAHPTEVRDVDERHVPPPVILEPPLYTRDGRTGDPFWHDRDYHWRHCYGDDCTLGEPPAGTSVRGRTGSVTV